MYSRGTHVSKLNERSAPCQDRQSISPSPRYPRGGSVGEGQLCMLSAAPTVRLQVRIGDSRLKDTDPHGFSSPAPCPLKGHISQRTLSHRSRGMQAPSSSKISTGYQPAVTGFPPRDSSRSPGSLRAGPREDTPTGDPGRDLRFRDIPADATRPDQLRIDPSRAKWRNRLGPGRSPRADSPRTSESGLNAELSRRHPSRSLRASTSAPSPGGDPGRGFLHRVPREMGVAGRRLDLAVPEQLADHRKDHTGRQWRVCDARSVAGTAQPLKW